MTPEQEDAIAAPEVPPLSSVVEFAEVKRLERAYNEHKQAEQWHKAEATRISYALMAARVRLKLAREAETAEAQD